MPRPFIQILQTILAAAFLAFCAAASAQAPFAPASAGGSAYAPNAEDEPLAPETNPAIRAALDMPRTEPRHYLTAVLALADLDRPELASPILNELQNLQLTEDQRADLVTQFGSHRMLQLSRNEALAPIGQEFADACMAAAHARNRDPQRIERLIQQLADADLLSRQTARADLAAAGEPAIVAVLEALARETDPVRRQALIAGAEQMAPESIGPIVGMLATGDRALRIDVVAMLTRLRVIQTMPLVASDLGASPAAAERGLADAINRYQRGTPALVADENNEIKLWSWDDAAKKLSVKKFSAGDAQNIWTARLAAELARLRPDRREYQRQAIVLGLEAARISGRRSSPAVDELLSSSSPALLSTALADAMKQKLPLAAIAIAEALSSCGDAGILSTENSQPAPLAAALQFPDRRVRFAALSAIIKLDPQQPYPGASRVPEALAYFATSANQRRAVVAMPVAEQATTVAGRLNGTGIASEAAIRGGAAVDLAMKSSDLEFILVDMDIQSPGIRDVLYALRTSAATGQTPIGLLATSERLPTAHELAAEHTRIVAFPRPQTDAATNQLVERLEALQADRLSAKERIAMAAQSLDWLGTLLAREHSFYVLRREAPVVEAALYLPELTDSSITALALVGTPSSQRALVEFASRQNMPIEARRRAAEAFKSSVARGGILLAEEEIVRQYDRYNASESADPDTQQILGSLLDTIESLRAKTAANLESPFKDD